MNFDPSVEEIWKINSLPAAKESRLIRGARQKGGCAMLHIPLPFYVPIYDGFWYGWDNNELRFLELIHYPRNLSFQLGEPIFEKDPAVKERATSHNVMYTVARFAMPFPYEELSRLEGFMAHPATGDFLARWPEDPPNISPELDELLEQGLNALNWLLRACRVISNDKFVRPIEGVERLPCVVEYTLWDIREILIPHFGVACLKRGDISLVSENLFMLHAEQQVDNKKLSPEDVAKTVAIGSEAYHGKPQPFFIAADLIRNAALRNREGDYNAAVIESVTAVEAFVSTFVRLHLEHKGKDRQQIENTFKSGLKEVIKQKMAKAIGLKMNEHNPSNPLDIWYTDAYEIRNRIVHRGEFSSRVDSQRVVKQSDNFIYFVGAKIREKSQQFEHLIGFFPTPNNE